MRRKCTTKRCTNRARAGGKTCDKCRMRKYRENNPVRSAYQTLKDHAAARNVEFSISFEYFTRFVKKYKYIQNKGLSKDSYTVERIDPRIGYVEGNLKVLTRSENSRKGAAIDKKILHYDWYLKTGIVVTVSSTEPADDDPF